MPLPENPQTREEMYLNGIATGSTDGLPDAPVTREEMYLDYIARNGGGGGGGGGGGSSTLAGLTDVDISNPSDGQTLVYDAASSKWVNGSGGGGGGVLVVNTPLIDGVATMDKTWQEIYDAVYAVVRTRNIGEGYDVWAYDQVSAVGESESKYFVETVGGYRFVADSTDDYPVESGIL